MDPLSALIGGGFSLFGGLLNSGAQADANAANLAFAREQAMRNERLQREFAQSGIQWRVEDAKKAGIHPMYALGTGVTPFSPSSSAFQSVPETGMGSALSSMGQDLSRAIHATRSAAGREDAFSKTMQELQISNITLKNDLIAAQIAKIRQGGGNPPLPAGDAEVPQEGPEKENQGVLGGRVIQSDPSVSGANWATNRYGEFIGDAVWGPYVMWKDYHHHQQNDPMSGMHQFRDRRAVWHGEMTQAEYDRKWKER